MIIRGGCIHDAIHAQPYTADIIVRDGKIADIAKDAAVLDGEEIIDAAGLQVYPGLVEAHCHVGVTPFACPKDGSDLSEKNDIISPQLRAIDAYNPMDKNVRTALEAGITTVSTGPGSVNIVGGTFIVVKTIPGCVDDIVLSKDAAMKCAFGENPKNGYYTKNDSTRMTTASKLRELLHQSAEYSRKCELAGNDPDKMPKFDMKLHAMLPVIRGEMPLKVHAHRAYDISTAIRIAKEFGVRLTLEHCTEGHLMVNELIRAGYPVAVGPSFTNASKPELENKTLKTPGVLAAAGLPVSIITDSPVIPLEYLPLCASLAVKHGMDPFAALQAITINPARHMGVDKRVGSLEIGKDADIVFTDGDILDIRNHVCRVIVNGETVFSAQ